MLRLVFLLLSVLCVQLAEAQNVNYDIAPLDRGMVSCAKQAQSGVKKNFVEIYSVETVKKKPNTEAVPPRKKKQKKQEQPVATASYGYVAKAVQGYYDPNEVLTNGFSVSLWVAPFASPAAGHGFVMYPAKGRDVNGIGQSQWGMTVGKDCIRVYEKYVDEKQILEYRHNEKEDFFITLVCRNGTPTLYVNGGLVATGEQSVYSPHPAFEGTAACPASLKFIGKSTAFHYFPKALTNAEVRGLYETEYEELHHVK